MDKQPPNTDHKMTLACVIVTFNPDITQFSRVLQASLPQAHAVIVVDNGSSPQFVSYLDKQAALADTLHVIPLPNNQGIAAAINRGMAKAKALHSEYVLLLDHDSIPSTDLLDKLYLAAVSQLHSGKKIAAIGAKIFDPRSNRELGFYRMRNGRWSKALCGTQKTGLIDCDYLNSSGSFIPVSAFDDIGPFNENFFVDHVDTEWFMRAQALGYVCFGLCEGALEHYMGDAVIRYWLWGWRHMPRRSPQRHYYIVRNSLWLYRYAYVPLAWKANNFIKLIFTFCYFSTFDFQRSAQFKLIVKGFIDGIKGEKKTT
jgi:rhamnosyltransferase